MKDKVQRYLLAAGQVDPRYVRMLVLIGTMVLFVTVGGAPEGGGPCGSC